LSSARYFDFVRGLFQNARLGSREVALEKRLDLCVAADELASRALPTVFPIFPMFQRNPLLEGKNFDRWDRLFQT
jgi:hypothetical protein